MDLYELLGIDLNDPGQKLADDMMRSERAMLDALFEARRRKGVSQKDLGHEMGVTQSAVARIEGGDRDPRLSTLRRYAAALDMRITFDVKPARHARPEPSSIAEEAAEDYLRAWERGAGQPRRDRVGR